MTPRAPLSERLYHTLLRLLPREFRRDFGDDMAATFRAERGEARGLGLFALWAAALADLARTAPAQHWDVFARDARFALRGMVRRPGLTITAVLTLGLGIGANVAMFGVVDAVLLAPLPYADPDRLVVVQERNAGKEPGSMGYLTLRDLAERAGVFTSLAAASQSYAILAGDGRDAERIGAMRVSASYFEMVGVRPALGRGFTEAEDRPGPARRVTVLADSLWRRRYGADPAIVGRAISIAGNDFTVVGVMPKAFEDLVAARLYEGAELWTPLGYDAAASYACRTCRHLRVFARLSPGITPGRAESDVSALLAGLAREHPREYDRPTARVRTLADFFLGPVRPVLIALWAGVVVLLLAACANVANLLLLRASERGPEMAVRAALGVTPGRLVRQLATESALLAALGGLAGLLPAWAALRLAATYGPAQLPRLADASLDARVALAAVAVSALSALVFGLVPLRQMARAGTSAASQHGARTTDGARTWRVRATLVAANVAMATVLLVGAGLLVRSLDRLLAVPAGLDASGVLTFRIDLAGPRYASNDVAVEIGRTTGFYASVLDRLRALPDVTAASAVSTLPLGGGMDSYGFHVAGRISDNPEQAPDADRFGVMPGFFETVRLPLLRGRALDARDVASAPPVAVVNQRIADELFPGEDPIGREVMLGPPDAQRRTIVGIAKNTRHHGLDVPPGYQVYVPSAQWAWAEPTLTVLVRSRQDPAALAAPAREIVRALDPAQPVTAVRTYSSVLSESTGTRRFATALLTVFALTALALAVVGLYGALGVLVRQRERELGVRLALGAAARDIRALVLRQGLAPAAAGLAVGLVAAAASARLLSSLLYDVRVGDPRTFASAAAVLLATGLLAAMVPAWRAARIDPARTLRGD